MRVVPARDDVEDHQSNDGDGKDVAQAVSVVPCVSPTTTQPTSQDVAQGGWVAPCVSCKPKKPIWNRFSVIASELIIN